MSLILDALRRAERDRQLKRAPDLSAIYEETHDHRRPRRMWVWISGGLALGVGLGFLVFSLTASEHTHGNAVEAEKVSKNAPKQVAAARDLPEPPPSAAQAKGTQGAASPPAETASPALASSPAALKETVDARPEASPRPSSMETPPDGHFERGVLERPSDTADAATDAMATAPSGQGRMTVQARVDDPASPAGADLLKDEDAASIPVDDRAMDEAAAPQKPETKAAQDIPLLSELSEDMREKIGRLEINVHVYSEDPRERLVFINMRNRNVGDQIGETGPVLKEITPEGVIIDYGEGLARVKVVGGRD